MNLKKKLWRLLSVLSTLLLVILPISGCDYSLTRKETPRQVLTLPFQKLRTPPPILPLNRIRRVT